MLFDMDLKLEVIEEDKVTKAANPRPILVVAVLEMGFEFVKLAECHRSTLETGIHLVFGGHVILSLGMLVEDLVT